MSRQAGGFVRQMLPLDPLRQQNSCVVGKALQKSKQKPQRDETPRFY